MYTPSPRAVASSVILERLQRPASICREAGRQQRECAGLRREKQETDSPEEVSQRHCDAAPATNSAPQDPSIQHTIRADTAPHPPERSKSVRVVSGRREWQTPHAPTDICRRCGAMRRKTRRDYRTARPLPMLSTTRSATAQLCGMSAKRQGACGERAPPRLFTGGVVLIATSAASTSGCCAGAICDERARRPSQPAAPHSDSVAQQQGGPLPPRVLPGCSNLTSRVPPPSTCRWRSTTPCRTAAALSILSFFFGVFI